MSQVLLIDADSKIPNLPLMKLGTFHKMRGDVVRLVKCNLSYYPNKKKKHFWAPENYDKKYCSVVFKGNRDFIVDKDIVFGGNNHESC